jgi:hypothetical protein
MPQPSGAIPQSNFVVLWGSRGQDGSDYGVFGQCYTGSGDRLRNGVAVILRAAVDLASRVGTGTAGRLGERRDPEGSGASGPGA